MDRSESSVIPVPSASTHHQCRLNCEDKESAVEVAPKGIRHVRSPVAERHSRDLHHHNAHTYIVVLAARQKLRQYHQNSRRRPIFQATCKDVLANP